MRPREVLEVVCQSGVVHVDVGWGGVFGLDGQHRINGVTLKFGFETRRYIPCYMLQENQSNDHLVVWTQLSKILRKIMQVVRPRRVDLIDTTDHWQWAANSKKQVSDMSHQASPRDEYE